MIICGSCNSKFPTGTFHKCSQNGTELRDQLAMAALTGLLSNPAGIPSDTDYCKIAYGFADSMLKVRSNNETKTQE